MRKVDVRHCSWISFAKLMSSVRIRRLRRHILQLMFPIDVSTCFWRRSRHVQWHSSEFYGVVNLRSQFTSASDFIFRYKNSRYARRNCVTHQLLANCWAHDMAHDRQPCLFIQGTLSLALLSSRKSNLNQPHIGLLVHTAYVFRMYYVHWQRT